MPESPERPHQQAADTKQHNGHTISANGAERSRSFRHLQPRTFRGLPVGVRQSAAPVRSERGRSGVSTAANATRPVPLGVSAIGNVAGRGAASSGTAATAPHSKRTAGERQHQLSVITGESGVRDGAHRGAHGRAHDGAPARGRGAGSRVWRTRSAARRRRADSATSKEGLRETRHAAGKLTRSVCGSLG